MSLLPIFLVLLGLISLIFATDIPSQVHIALAGKTADGDSNGMAVTWHTFEETKTSIVKFGTKSGEYTSQVSGTASVYYQTFNHHAVLSDLAPETKYYYIVGDEATNVWSKEYTFTSASLNKDTRNFSFFVFGDLGVVNGEETAKYINDNINDVSLVWHAGDVSYADDSFLHKGCVFKFCYEDTINQYLERVEPWASKVPYMVLPGNHEADCHDPACLTDSEKRVKLSNFTSYNHRYDMPSKESSGVLNMWYSFNYGNVHFISLDTETGYPGANEETRYIMPCGGFGDQLSWLENDLIEANKNRDKRPWVFASGHHPMYHGASVNPEFQAAIEDLFNKYKVDMYFAGHEHSYERDYPVYNGKVDENATEKLYSNPSYTTHILIGGAGNDEMHKIKYVQGVLDPSPEDRPLKRISKLKKPDNDEDDIGEWTVKVDRDNHVGIGKVHIIDDNTLQFDYIRTMTGEVYDSFQIVKNK